MASVSCHIILVSDEAYKTEVLKLLVSEHWSIEAESALLIQLHEVFTLLRPVVQTLNVDVQVQVADAVATSFLLNKKFGSSHHSQLLQKLTTREQQVMELISQGLTNKEIAQKLYISIETVRSHRKHIMLKTGTKNTALLIKYYDQLLIHSNDAL